MKNFFKDHRFLAGLLSVFISVFLVAIVVYGATTIGTNIQTSGTASSTSATTTDYLYVGTDITELAGWDFTGGDLIVSGAAHFAAKATSTTAFAVGAGTINNLDMTGGDFYVQGDAEIDGILYGNWASSTSATTTDYLYVGPDGTESIDFSGGDLYVADDAEIDGSTTLGGGNAITKFMFGYCNIATTTIAINTSEYIECTGATGVAAGDRVFVTATSSLAEHFVIQAASSTEDAVIHTRIWCLKDAADTGTGAISFNWMAIR